MLGKGVFPASFCVGSLLRIKVIVKAGVKFTRAEMALRLIDLSESNIEKEGIFTIETSVLKDNDWGGEVAFILFTSFFSFSFFIRAFSFFCVVGLQFRFSRVDRGVGVEAVQPGQAPHLPGRTASTAWPGRGTLRVVWHAQLWETTVCARSVFVFDVSFCFRHIFVFVRVFLVRSCFYLF
jgi:hypothetical protein